MIRSSKICLLASFHICNANQEGYNWNPLLVVASDWAYSRGIIILGPHIPISAIIEAELYLVLSRGFASPAHK